jgi:hypothetical protein
VATKEGELLARLEIPIGTVFRKVADLRAGSRRNESKRKRAHELLH